jgi:hypothetical protein
MAEPVKVISATANRDSPTNEVVLTVTAEVSTPGWNLQCESSVSGTLIDASICGEGPSGFAAEVISHPRQSWNLPGSMTATAVRVHGLNSEFDLNV